MHKINYFFENEEKLSEEIKEKLNINDSRYPVDKLYLGEIIFIDNKDSYERSPGYGYIDGYQADDENPEYENVKFENIEIKKLEKIRKN